ncbi:YdeI/OmpD-associated family protein [Flammeovirga agarivorans]|uniref:YdhG-like domain-containing protein n=1 Tax=Flammeovirga agarivorans TaxID=2726742 RepID=A0A7X8XWR8_9BACT|nr:DUF1801 domain-containing protein [Flammeovirga agarivorans]NLR92375.1 hypothetical protein [Flammeovirga agarivorans]
MKKFETVDDYILHTDKWKEELNILRELLLNTVLEEGVKWGAPIYMINKKNVVGIASFKNYVGLWFHQGALLANKENVLINAQEDKTKALRQWRFESKEELITQLNLIKEYVDEAISNQQNGLEVKIDRTPKPLILPNELVDAFVNDKELETAFKSLTLSKKREYGEYISTAKREATKLSRIEKIIPMIKNGIGLNDKYKK